MLLLLRPGEKIIRGDLDENIRVKIVGDSRPEHFCDENLMISPEGGGGIVLGNFFPLFMGKSYANVLYDDEW